MIVELFWLKLSIQSFQVVWHPLLFQYSKWKQKDKLEVCVMALLGLSRVEWLFSVSKKKKGRLKLKITVLILKASPVSLVCLNLFLLMFLVQIINYLSFHLQYWGMCWRKGLLVVPMVKYCWLFMVTAKKYLVQKAKMLIVLCISSLEVFTARNYGCSFNRDNGVPKKSKVFSLRQW